MSRTLTITALLVALPTLGAGMQDERVPLHAGLGDHTHPITTSVPEAQAYFDQGLRLTYAFHHAEAIRSFQEAQRLDPDCAMCFWGEAYAWGPNINAPMGAEAVPLAWAALQAAKDRAPGASPAEQDWIAALATRYARDPGADRSALDEAFARAMVELADRYPDNDDALAIMAEAHLDLTPWSYWVDSSTLRPGVARGVEALETVLARNPDHAGACHFYIHAVEAHQPHRAEACADRLASLMPAAGHIVHMPAHIFVRVGRFADAVETNHHAMHADQAILEDVAPDGLYRLGYMPHNPDFLRFAASMAGNVREAMQGARETSGSIDPAFLEIPGMAFAHHFRSTPTFVMVRFGLWDDVMALPEPGHAYGQGVWRYARGLARAARGDFGGAEEDLAALVQLRQSPGLAEEFIMPGNSLFHVLRIAAKELEGEILFRKGRKEEGLKALRAAADFEDAMTYDEPPSWHMPVRHRLGARLVEAGRMQEAVEVYREDLRKYPGNVWSLTGLAVALEGAGESGEAARVRRELAGAGRIADVEIGASVR